MHTACVYVCLHTACLSVRGRRLELYPMGIYNRVVARGWHEAVVCCSAVISQSSSCKIEL